MAELIKNIGGIRNSANHTAKCLRSWQIELPLMHLCPIIQGEKNMGELEESTNILQPPLSQQLTVLRNEYIVSVRKSS
jgi:DNA-binding HxlR family transcriptional regulator